MLPREGRRADDEPDVAGDRPDRRQLRGDTGELDEGDQKRRDAARAVLERDQGRDLDHVDAHRDDPADGGPDHERRDDDRTTSARRWRRARRRRRARGRGRPVVAAPRARGRAELGDAGDQDDDDRQLDDVFCSVVTSTMVLAPGPAAVDVRKASAPVRRPAPRRGLVDRSALEHLQHAGRDREAADQVEAGREQRHRAEHELERRDRRRSRRAAGRRGW